MHATAPKSYAFKETTPTTVSAPDLTKGAIDALGIGSTLAELPLHTFSVTSECDIKTLMDRFTQFPDLPGVVLLEAGRIISLSRQQFLECLLQLGHTTLLRNGSIHIVFNQGNRKTLCLPGDTPVLLGAQQALRRPYEQQSDPILVQSGDRYQLLNAHTLNIAHWQIRGIETQIRYERLQMQLLQSEKMAALGRLVDGVAHEILDPVGFIWGNLSYIASYAQQQAELIAAYEAALPSPPDSIVQLQEDVELDYLRSDFPAAIKSAKGGAHRLRQLATSLQNFCHIDEIHPRPTDLNSLIDSTLRLLKSRLSSPIQIKRCYGKLPPVPCFSGQLSQVFMTIFTSAIDPLLAQAHLASYSDDSNDISLGSAPQITVATCICSEPDTPDKNTSQPRWVSIIISDNGPGILPGDKAHIIDSFSPESRSIRETGLAMSYQIVTAKHGGKLWIRSCHASEVSPTEANKIATGTEFEILLPLTSCEPE